MASIPGRSKGAASAPVESPANAAVKQLRKALRQGELFAGKFWVAESPKLLDEALRSGLRVPLVYAASSRLREFDAQFAGRFQGEWVPLGEKALESLASLESAQGLVALVERPIVEEDAFFASQELLVVLDRIQDPGNAGTILRAAEAFGATGMLFLAGSVSGDSPKLLRASAGSRFRVPVLEGMAAGQFLERARRDGIHLFAASPSGEKALALLDWRFPAALIVGSEGAGVQTELLRKAESFRIPTQGVESLNAGISAAIALYAVAAHRDSPAAAHRGPG
ncbi:MAG: RNA methyltransferase [Bryobacterales bacterium]|nr:RNA methyltransferase [Bryobacterales bacterium]